MSFFVHFNAHPSHVTGPGPAIYACAATMRAIMIDSEVEAPFAVYFPLGYEQVAGRRRLDVRRVQEGCTPPNYKLEMPR